MEAAMKNAALLQGLSDTEYALSALRQSQTYLDDLEREMYECNKQIGLLASKTKIEKEQHDKYKDSIMRRFMYRAGGKKDRFEEKASKEEREYFEALNAENQARSRREEWNKSLEAAKKDHLELEKVANKHRNLQTQLDALYDGIFAGPSPEFPSEDAKEYAFREARDAFNAAEQRQKAETQAVSCLESADGSMTRAVRELDTACDYSRADMFGGGTLTDMMERDALSRAEREIDKVKMLVDQAQRFSPEVRGLGPIEIENRHILSDVVFDNMFSDMRMHEKIKSSRARCHQEARNLKFSIVKAKEREAELKMQAGQALTKLESARRDLQRVRQEAFETVAQLPSYEQATKS